MIGVRCIEDAPRGQGGSHLQPGSGSDGLLNGSFFSKCRPEHYNASGRVAGSFFESERCVSWIVDPTTRSLLNFRTPPGRYKGLLKCNMLPIERLH